MARPAKNLNQKSGEYLEKNHLEENPEGLPDESGIVIAKEIPKTRRVVFLNGRDPGVALPFHYCTATHPLHHYTLYHGLEDEIPEEVIEHLESLGENQYAYRTGRNGLPEMYVKSKRFYYQFRTVKQQVA